MIMLRITSETPFPVRRPVPSSENPRLVRNGRFVPDPIRVRLTAPSGESEVVHTSTGMALAVAIARFAQHHHISPAEVTAGAAR
jgi:hypothetical protein